MLVASSRAAIARPPSVTIYHLPDDVSSDIAIAPERLPGMRDVRRRIVVGEAAVAHLRAAVRAAVPHPTGAGAPSLDARWSAIVDDGGAFRRVACDRFGTNGTIDGRRVRFASTRVVEALRAMFRTGS
jgi:hypothetical protein